MGNITENTKKSASANESRNESRNGRKSPAEGFIKERKERVLVNFALVDDRVREFIHRHQLDFDVGVGGSSRIHGFQIAAVENVQREGVVDEDGPHGDGSHGTVLRCHTHPLQLVLVDQPLALGAVQLQQ